MIGTSRGELIFIRLCIAYFRYTPLVYAAALLVVNTVFRASPWHHGVATTLGTLLAAELLFYLTIHIPYTRRLHLAAVHPPPLTPAERSSLFYQCTNSIPDPERYLRWWFLGSEISDIHKDNLRDFLRWAFFETGTEHECAHLPHQEDITEQLEEFVVASEKRLGYPLRPGRGKAKCLRLTLEHVHTTYRGLAWYVIVFVVDHITHAAMRWRGFEYHGRHPAAALTTFPPRPLELLAKYRSPAPGLGYWHRRACPENKELPIVFLHGIGIGIWCNVRFLAELCLAKKRRGAGIIIPELLPVSFRLTAAPVSKAEFLVQMTQILKHHNGRGCWDKFAVVSHSYGSVLSSYMVHSPTLGPRVASVVLIDPVSIMLHLPDVAYNFTRRRPQRANEWQLWYFASTDAGVAHCLARHFFWRDCIVWTDELCLQGCRKAWVCLGGRDVIIDSASVAQYLEGSGVEVMMFPHLDHAQVFDSPPDRRRLVEIVDSVCHG
ncbi:hypothetical protein CDD82_404 [Ophiocordyceps australis]|uniref:AB hydrolase-1 domain-containing protein n=1 Tax=Ophiocordyceps australis TaxID=1399860 RepID=A0A2C5YGI6_9HYPO|nr:hypothetical protein CDD82_404 [Ophiocordyceps australis]